MLNEPDYICIQSVKGEIVVQNYHLGLLHGVKLMFINEVAGQPNEPLPRCLGGPNCLVL